MMRDAVTIDTPALETIAQLVEQHAAEWTRVCADLSGLLVELNTSERIDWDGRPVATYRVCNEGGAHLLTEGVDSDA
jgi:hypothetical protein